MILGSVNDLIDNRFCLSKLVNVNMLTGHFTVLRYALHTFD